MRKLLIILASIASILALILAFTPIGSLTLLPALFGLLLGFIALKMTQKEQRKTRFTKILIAICFLASAITFGKTLLTEDKVAEDINFKKKQEENDKESLKDLNELEKELDELDSEE